ncbi:MAG: hypothetical protein M1148_02830 [Candidatus Thermoplasmatota archaeon]|nr:hypothetical protein [Candidatus Thermoplasmatota archaeon]MCL5438113.1 hypothetical protein [Candidatus Thermoplasmatota archaeon]
MKYLARVIPLIILAMFLLTIAPTSFADTPPLHPPSGNLPSVTYYVSSTEHFTVTPTEWQSLFKGVYDNSSFVSYNWTSNLTQYLILFDLSYTGLNPYGLQFVTALSWIGFPSMKNMTMAFNMTKNYKSQISGYTNIQALDAGAYPGFSWSVPINKNPNKIYLDLGVIGAIIASVIVLYFVFNRKK